MIKVTTSKKRQFNGCLEIMEAIKLKLLRLKGEHPSLHKIQEKIRKKEIYSASLVTLTKECQNACEMCFTEKKRENNSQEIAKEAYNKIIEITSAMGGEAVRIVGLGEPLLDPNLDYVLDLAKDKSLQVVLFTNGLKLTEEQLDKLNKKGNVSLMTKLWGNPETMAKMTNNKAYLKNTVNFQTDLGEIEVPGYIALVLNSGFHETNNKDQTNFGLEFMVTEKNIGQLPLALAFMIENGISPYIRTPFPVDKSEGIELADRGVGLPTKEQFEEINKEIKEVLAHYGIKQASLRQGSKTYHCMRTAYNFVFENVGGRVIAKPCHHTPEPNIVIARDMSVAEFRNRYFEIPAYAALREAICVPVSGSHCALEELMDGCVCAKRYQNEE